MRVRTLLVALGVVAGAAVCVRLGFWQVARWHEKQDLNAALRTSLAGPVLRIEGALPGAEVDGRLVELEGEFDLRWHVLLAGRVHEGTPGVEVLTPLRLPSGEAVLVDRGWLPAPDAATARPQDYPEPCPRMVRGIAQLPRGDRRPGLRVIESDSVTVLGMARFDLDSLRAHAPYPIAAFAIRELPGRDLPSRPLRSTPRPFDESMHVGYAVQWFLFAAILIGGSSAVAWGRRRS